MTEQQALNTRQARDLVARGVVGGLGSGAAFLALNMWFATSVGDPAKAPLLMISTIVAGDEAMMSGGASTATGLGSTWGCRRRSDWSSP